MKLRIFLAIIAILLAWFIFHKCTTHKSSKVYTVARDPAWAPLNLLNKSTDMLVFSDELLTAIADKEAIPVDIISAAAVRLFQGLDNGEYDGILTSVVPLPSNISRYDISDPYYLLGPVLIVTTSSPVTSISQMENKTIGVLRDASLVFDLDKYPALNIVPYDNPVVAIENLIKNNIDGVIMDRLPAYSYTNKFYSGQIKIATLPLTKMGLRLVARNDVKGKALIEAFDKGLEAVRQDGTYDKLIQKWDLAH